MRVDLHLHTRFSDGTLTVPELLAKVEENGITHFSITDHDSLGAYERLWGDDGQTGAVPGSLKLFAGIEINTGASHEMHHILGFGSKMLADKTLRAKLKGYREARLKRNEMIVGKLNALGIEIDYAAIVKRVGEAIGRPLIADEMVAKGVVANRKEAFMRYLAEDKAAYVPSLGPKPKEAIEAIAAAGGIPVVAHPGEAHLTQADIAKMMDWGLRGVEAYHPLHDEAKTREYCSIARRLGLFITCGSDYHGPGSGYDQFFHYELGAADFDDFFARIS
ncbi:MAG: PHP domain-containing protein [Elusimicrobiota bacterium]